MCINHLSFLLLENMIKSSSIIMSFSRCQTMIIIMKNEKIRRKKKCNAAKPVYINSYDEEGNHKIQHNSWTFIKSKSITAIPDYLLSNVSINFT